MPDSTPPAAGERAQRDALLTSVWWLLTALMGLCLILGAGGLLAYPYLLINQADIVARMAGMGIEASALPWLGALGGLVAAVSALTFFFLRHLRRIVDSVADGQPFEPLNADRLQAMAWLSIAIQVAVVPMTRLIVWFDALPYKPNVHHDSDGVEIAGIVLTLVLFVLARVFREGTRLRDDLAEMI